MVSTATGKIVTGICWEMKASPDSSAREMAVLVGVQFIRSLTGSGPSARRTDRLKKTEGRIGWALSGLSMQVSWV